MRMTIYGIALLVSSLGTLCGQEVGPTEFIPASEAGRKIDPSYYEASKKLKELVKELSEKTDFISPEDSSLFHDWTSVAVFDGRKLVPSSNDIKVSMLPGTYGEYVKGVGVNTVAVYNAKWHNTGKIYWSEMKSNPPPGKESEVCAYVYVKIEGNAAVLSHFEFPVDPEVYEFQAELQMYPAGKTVVLSKSPSGNKKKSRIDLIRDFIEYAKPAYRDQNLMPRNLPIEFRSPKTSLMHGGLYKEYEKHLTESRVKSGR